MITTQQMREVEDKSGMSKLALMERAGKGIFQVLNEKLGLKDKRILIVAYHGNNGGDGFVAARYLCEECEVDVLFIGDESKFKKEAEVNFKKIEENERIQFLTVEDTDFDSYDIIIDAILGTGVQGMLKEEISNVIESMNSSKAYKVAVDIPTGMNPDTGVVEHKCVNADLVITFHDIKAGLEKLADKTVVVDIGIPKEAG